jgi:hypothetical protein
VREHEPNRDTIKEGWDGRVARWGQPDTLSKTKTPHTYNPFHTYSQMQGASLVLNPEVDLEDAHPAIPLGGWGGEIMLKHLGTGHDVGPLDPELPVASPPKLLLLCGQENPRLPCKPSRVSSPIKQCRNWRIARGRAMANHQE